MAVSTETAATEQHAPGGGASFQTVTELPGSGATREGLSMLATRYRIAAQLSRGKEVLEVACGPGMGLGYLARSASRVVGGDFDPANVEAAKRHYGSRVEVHQVDAQALPFPDRSFDVVVLLEALYFIPDARRAVQEARRVLRPGGALFICSANRERPDFNPAPQSTRYHSLSELGSLMEEAGFQPELSAAFPVTAGGLKSRVFRLLRQVAVQFNLIPKTMDGKEGLKRLLYGKLEPLPVELKEGDGEVVDPVPVSAGSPVTGYKVIYAIGRLPV